MDAGGNAPRRSHIRHGAGRVGGADSEDHVPRQQRGDLLRQRGGGQHQELRRDTGIPQGGGLRRRGDSQQRHTLRRQEAGVGYQTQPVAVALDHGDDLRGRKTPQLFDIARQRRAVNNKCRHGVRLLSVRDVCKSIIHGLRRFAIGLPPV